MFLKGETCPLRALEESDHEASTWTEAVNAGLTTQHLLTGSFPMRAIDIKAVWKGGREAGDVLFGIWMKIPRGPDGTRFDPVFIGTCGLHSHREIYRSWEARFLIFNAEAVGMGIGEEVVRLLTEYAFRRLNAHKVWLGCSADNLRAVKCYLNAGYQIEGTLRDELFYDGVYHHAYRMNVLEHEWRSFTSVQASSASDVSIPSET
jgi:RimJ/RimL family protein N-acetyltransferase